jgi:DNA-nicking Smr family endonuclease
MPAHALALQQRGGDIVRSLISGFVQAHRDHGGAGAFYVFLKRIG